jgi:hypothetical protein
VTALTPPRDVGVGKLAQEPLRRRRDQRCGRHDTVNAPVGKDDEHGVDVVELLARDAGCQLADGLVQARANDSLHDQAVRRLEGARLVRA